MGFLQERFHKWHNSVLESASRGISGGYCRFSHGIWDFNRIFMRLKKSNRQDSKNRVRGWTLTNNTLGLGEFY
jgi:hypothetical protein